MKSLFTYIFFIVILTIFSSCGITTDIAIQTYRPVVTESTIPYKKIIIAKSQSLESYSYEADICIEGLVKKINYATDIEVCQIINLKDFNFNDDLMNLLDTLNADGLLVLENLSINVYSNINLVKKRVYYDNDGLRRAVYPPYYIVTYHTIDLDLSVIGQWILYDHNKESRSFNTRKYLQHHSRITDHSYIDKKIERFINQLCYENGLQCIKIFEPYYSEYKRLLYYNGNKYMISAFSEIQRNNWERAKDIWIGQLNGNVFIKKRAYHNLAVYYEYIGDYEKAIEYANKSQETFFTLDTYDLLHELKTNYNFYR